MLQGHKNSGESLTFSALRMASSMSSSRWVMYRLNLSLITTRKSLAVISLDINPLGGMLATGSGDNTARICEFFSAWTNFERPELTTLFACRDIFCYLITSLCFAISFLVTLAFRTLAWKSLRTTLQYNTSMHLPLIYFPV